eukprot:Rmarinus@m.18104
MRPGQGKTGKPLFSRVLVYCRPRRPLGGVSGAAGTKTRASACSSPESPNTPRCQCPGSPRRKVVRTPLGPSTLLRPGASGEPPAGLDTTKQCAQRQAQGLIRAVLRCLRSLLSCPHSRRFRLCLWQTPRTASAWRCYAGLRRFRMGHWRPTGRGGTVCYSARDHVSRRHYTTHHVPHRAHMMVKSLRSSSSRSSRSRRNSSSSSISISGAWCRYCGVGE